MNRSYYSASIDAFLDAGQNEILGELTARSEFAVDPTQRDAWQHEIDLLQQVLVPYRGAGTVYFEYSIPRLGRRIDVVAVVGPVVFVLEFKVGEAAFPAYAVDQVWDYGLDLKNFHESSHDKAIAPVLIATDAPGLPGRVEPTHHSDGLLRPIRCNSESLAEVLRAVLGYVSGAPIDTGQWESGRYCPTPTIIEAATALYKGHSVAEISRSDASAINLSQTSDSLADIIKSAQRSSSKAICFVTGVPGAGKTLVGLNIATTHIDKDGDLYSVFLSGNGPLVAVLREALARDKVQQERWLGKKVPKSKALSEVKMFIQNVHHFRDECLIDASRPPIEHVALFDEAQRAWNQKQTAKFMRQKKKVTNFNQSEPEFLIACLDRHPDWGVIVCLVGGGEVPMTYDEATGFCLRYGGCNDGGTTFASGYGNDLTAYDPATERWIALRWTDPCAPPRPRNGCTRFYAYDPVRRVTWFASGTSGNRLASSLPLDWKGADGTWQYDGVRDRFSLVPTTGPQPAIGVGCCYDSVNNLFVCKTQQGWGDVKVAQLDPDKRQWTAGPPPRALAYTYGCFVASLKGMLVIEPGKQGHKTLLYVSAESAWRELDPKPELPPVGGRPTTAYDPEQDMVICLLGEKTFVYDVKKNTWSPVETNAPGKASECLVCDTRHKVFLATHNMGESMWAFRYRN